MRTKTKKFRKKTFLRERSCVWLPGFKLTPRFFILSLIRWQNRPWWPSGLICHALDSSRDRQLVRSQVQNPAWGMYLYGRITESTQPTLTTYSWYPITVYSIRFNGCSYKPLIWIRGSRSHRSKTQMDCWKDEDTRKKGKMAE